MGETDAHLKKFQRELSSGTVALVLLAVLGSSDEALYEAAEHSWGPFFTFTPSYVVLDGSGTYDVGDLTLFRWYSE